MTAGTPSPGPLIIKLLPAASETWKERLATLATRYLRALITKHMFRRYRDWS